MCTSGKAGIPWYINPKLVHSFMDIRKTTRYRRHREKVLNRRDLFVYGLSVLKKWRKCLATSSNRVLRRREPTRLWVWDKGKWDVILLNVTRMLGQWHYKPCSRQRDTMCDSEEKRALMDACRERIELRDMVQKIRDDMERDRRRCADEHREALSSFKFRLNHDNRPLRRVHHLLRRIQVCFLYSHFFIYTNGYLRITMAMNWEERVEGEEDG